MKHIIPKKFRNKVYYKAFNKKNTSVAFPPPSTLVKVASKKSAMTDVIIRQQGSPPVM